MPLKPEVLDFLQNHTAGQNSQGDCATEFLEYLYPHRRAKQPGRFVRIAACLPGKGLPTPLVPTWVTEGVEYVDHITYPLFNKAWAIAAYMKHAAPKEDFVLVLDSDMLIHAPFLPSDFGIAPKRAAAENMWYLEVSPKPDLADVHPLLAHT